jgi:hypothetical protein
MGGRESAMYPVDQAVGVVEFASQFTGVGVAVIGPARTGTLFSLLGGLKMFGNLADLVVQGREQITRLRGVGIFDHLGIITSAARQRDAKASHEILVRLDDDLPAAEAVEHGRDQRTGDDRRSLCSD